MILTGIESAKYLTTRGYGKLAQVGYDLTVKEIKKIVPGGGVYIEKTSLRDYKPVKSVDGTYFLEEGVYSLTFHQGCKLPSNIKASIIHRSSILRCGGMITSGVYDPGFEVDEMGAVLFVHTPFCIEQDARVAQIVLEECYNVEKEDLYDGQWQKEKDVK